MAPAGRESAEMLEEERWCVFGVCQYGGIVDAVELGLSRSVFSSRSLADSTGPASWLDLLLCRESAVDWRDRLVPPVA